MPLSAKQQTKQEPLSSSQQMSFSKFESIMPPAHLVATVKTYFKRIYGVDERGLIVFRVVFGCVLVLDLLERTGLLSLRPEDATTFFSDLGVEPRSEKTDWVFCIFCATGQPVGVWILFLVGFYTDLNIARGVNVQASALVSLFIHAGAYGRIRRCSIGADVQVQRLLFFMAFDPWLFGDGAFIQEGTAAQDGKRNGKKRRRSYECLLSVGTASLIISQGLVYIGAGLAKSRDVWMVSGIAIRDALESPFYGIRWALVEWMLTQPLLLKVASQITVIAEILIGVIAMLPILAPEMSRIFAFLGICGLHAGLAMCMRLGTFPLISVATAIPLLPSSVWNLVWPDKWSNSSERQHLECNGQVRSRLEQSLSGMHNAFRIAVCTFAIFWVTVSFPTALPKCEGKAESYGCLLPEVIRTEGWWAKIPFERDMRQALEMFGLAPFAFDMFNVPRSDHGWFVVLAQERDSKRIITLPYVRQVSSAAEAFSRPAGGFPSMRWRQYWFHISNSGSEAVKMREQLSGYLCRRPPEGRHLARIQMFWTPNLRKELHTPVLDYPIARPSRVFSWYCTDDLVKKWKSGNCTECEQDFFHIPPLANSSGNQSNREEL